MLEFFRMSAKHLHWSRGQFSLFRPWSLVTDPRNRRQSQWRAQQCGVTTTTRHQNILFKTSFSQLFGEALWANETVSEFHLLGICYKRICHNMLMKSFFHVMLLLVSLSQQVKAIVLEKNKKSCFYGWLTLTGNKAKLERRECTYWFTTFSFNSLFFHLFVAIFLLGWVPSNPTHVFGMFFLLMAW